MHAFDGVVKCVAKCIKSVNSSLCNRDSGVIFVQCRTILSAL